jgi:VanZ family protein
VKKKYRIISIIPPVFIMVGIFYFSHQTAVESSNLSGYFVERWFGFMENLFKWDINFFGNVIRKSAHMTEYAILAITVSFSLYAYEKKGIGLILRSEVICILYAMTDEFHQLFIPGRSGEITDVFIDGFGALIGCLLFILIIKKILVRIYTI